MTTALYVLVAIAVVALVPVERLAESESPLATAVASVSPLLADIVGGLALFATANTVLVVFVASSRMVMAMARGRDLPRVLASVHSARSTPWVAAVALLVVALALLPFGDLALIASMSSLASLAGFAAVNIALIVLRVRDPHLRRPFRVPLSVGRIPLLPVLGTVAIVGLLLQFDAVAYAVTGAVLIVGLGLRVARRFATNR